jgi:hypothetical protein
MQGECTRGRRYAAAWGSHCPACTHPPPHLHPRCLPSHDRSQRRRIIAAVPQSEARPSPPHPPTPVETGGETAQHTHIAAPHQRRVLHASPSSGAHARALGEGGERTCDTGLPARRRAARPHGRTTECQSQHAGRAAPARACAVMRRTRSHCSPLSCRQLMSSREDAELPPDPFEPVTGSAAPAATTAAADEATVEVVELSPLPEDRLRAEQDIPLSSQASYDLHGQDESASAPAPNLRHSSLYGSGSHAPSIGASPAAAASRDRSTIPVRSRRRRSLEPIAAAAPLAASEVDLTGGAPFPGASSPPSRCTCTRGGPRPGSAAPAHSLPRPRWSGGARAQAPAHGRGLRAALGTGGHAH